MNDHTGQLDVTAEIDFVDKGEEEGYNLGIRELLYYIIGRSLN